MQTVLDNIDPARAQALHVTLRRDGKAPETGDALANFGHQIYFWEPLATDQLGPDGHPKLGGLIPDLGLEQRMWAGGRLEFQQPLRLGQAARKLSSVEKTKETEGRSGKLAFVTLRHEIWQGETLCVTEFQDLVYRARPEGQRPVLPPQARTDETFSKTVDFDTTMLFRYSALTFNGHRIHYDADYSRTVEGYAGLVVHGPLLAQLLMDMAAEQLGKLTEFSFRATSPLMDFERATLCWNNGDAWVRGPDGRQCMEAQAR